VFFHAPTEFEVALLFQYNRCGQTRYDCHIQAIFSVWQCPSPFLFGSVDEHIEAEGASRDDLDRMLDFFNQDE
jgi:hypothetical protein